jgi:hypothetical protein
LFCVP